VDLTRGWSSGGVRATAAEVVSEELVWEPLPTITARLVLPTLFARVLGAPA